MNSSNFFRFFILKLSLLSIYKCNSLSHHLHELAEFSNFHQITFFVSKNFTNVMNLNPSNFRETPNKIYSLDFDNLKLYSDVSVSKNIYSLQESLIVFYTSNFFETDRFINFLVNHLSFEKRPKCLIVYSGINEDKVKISAVTNILKNAWEDSFLDFTLVMADSNIFYYYNPFKNVVYQKELQDTDVEIFPDKFFNGCNGYKFFTAKDDELGFNFTEVRRDNRIVEFRPHILFVSEFLEILNLRIVKTGRPNMLPSFWDYFEVESHYYLVPADALFDKSIAVVPILYKNFQINISYLALIASFVIGLIINFSYSLHQLRSRHVRVWDVIRLLFGQSIQREPRKSVHRVIYLTAVLAFVKITNDFLLDILTILIEKEEIPFESYKDLYDSNLQTYDVYRKPNKSYDNYLQKVINRTLYGVRSEDCLKMLTDWKNVSCFTKSTVMKMYLSKFLNGSRIMKIVEPPIWDEKHMFYHFLNGSPFAMKFLEVMRRVKETSLMHWPALVQKRRLYDLGEKIEVTSNSNKIKVIHLMLVLSFGVSISVIVFIIELIKVNMGKYLLSR